MNINQFECILKQFNVGMDILHHIRYAYNNRLIYTFIEPDIFIPNTHSAFKSDKILTHTSKNVIRKKGKNTYEDLTIVITLPSNYTIQFNSSKRNVDNNLINRGVTLLFDGSRENRK